MEPPRLKPKSGASIEVCCGAARLGHQPREDSKRKIPARENKCIYFEADFDRELHLPILSITAPDLADMEANL